MKVRRARAETSAETREALLRAAAQLFQEEGLDAPSLDAICARAGKTRGAFYVHFADRDALLAAVMERTGAPLLDVLLGAPGETNVTLREAVGRFVGSIAAGTYPLAGGSGIRTHQLLDACARDPAIRANYAALLGDGLTRLASAVDAGQSEGTLRRDVGAGEAAAILLAAVLGVQTLLELQVPIPLPTAAEALVRMMEKRRE